MSIKKGLYLAVAAAPLLSFGAIAQDQDQDGEDSESRATEIFREVITVTATKKANAEDVQDVPIAVSAFGAAQLDQINFKDLSTVGALIPNTTLRETGTLNGAVGFFIRGTGSLATVPSVDPAIGLFVDGMYYANILGASFDNFDLESIEVLRGPQGILFGRNVVGGAVLVNTSRPTDEFSLRLSGQINSGLRGTGPEYQVTGVVSGPLSDNFRAKAAVYYNKDEGWFENLFDGENFGESETILLRGALEVDLSDNINAIVRYEYGEINSQGQPFKSARSFLGSPGLDLSRDNHELSLNFPGDQASMWHNLVFETNIDVSFGNGVITNIFGWRDIESDGCIDVDATPGDVFNSSCLQNPPGSDPIIVDGIGLKQHQVSDELRYAGTLGRAEVTVGVYFFSQYINYGEARSVLGGFVKQAGGGSVDHEVYSAFINADTAITDQLTFLSGLRVTHEKKSTEISDLTAPKTGPIPGFCAFGAGDCLITFSDSDKWSNVDFRFGLQYEFSDDVMAYAQWSTGHRAGGYNIRSTDLTVPPGPFDEETVRNYEIGLKSEPTDRILFNAAFFYQTSKDLQRSTIEADPVGGVRQLILNAADVRVWGLEADTQIVLSENLLFIGSIGYNNGKYTEVREDFLPASLGGIQGSFAEEEALEIQGLAPVTAAASIIHDLDLGGLGSVSTRVTYSHRDTSFGTNNDFILPSTDLVDFNVTWRPEDNDNISVSIFGRNMTNDVVFTGDVQLDTFAVFGTGTFSAMEKGRHVGIEIDFRL